MVLSDKRECMVLDLVAEQVLLDTHCMERRTDNFLKIYDKQCSTTCITLNYVYRAECPTWTVMDSNGSHCNNTNFIQ